ncbi:F-box domain-containing protein [Favolaschia claudopus]|uniref:F-box domain-containing protein n=1 Tax=Favolaschia claudopus TaxID=2862362 RepID=A0AAW0CT43_9AGAR
MTPDQWALSLRTDSNRPSNRQSSTVTTLSRGVKHTSLELLRSQASRIGRRSSAEVSEHVKPSPSSANFSNKLPVAKKAPVPDSLRKRPQGNVTPEATVGYRKCSSICCNYISTSLGQSESRSRALYLVRLNTHVDSTVCCDELTRAETRHETYQGEISRLKRILATCPPPGQTIPPTRGYKKVVTLCKHACCDPTLRPPRASTEMLRLRRIIRQLQIRARELLHIVNLKRCLLSPIRRLPPEILEMIFSFAVPNRCDTWPVTITHTTVAAIKIAHVCSHWRTVALNMTSLWATILFPPTQSRYQSSISQLEFYSEHAKSSPLTIHCQRLPSGLFLRKLCALSHRWYDMNIRIGNHALNELNVVGRNVPLVKSLFIYNECERNGTETNDTFETAPALRRVILSVRSGHIWPFSFIMPWEQLTCLSLTPISLSVFSECIHNCRQLLFFHAVVLPRFGESLPQMAELRHASLRKLVLQGSGCQEVIVQHSFPRLRSLSIVMSGGLHPEFFPFLARSTHLEMLSIRAWGLVTTADIVALFLATPSLRMLHFRDWRTVVVTSRLYGVPLVDDPSDEEIKPRSLAELGVDGCMAFEEIELRALLRERAERTPSFDPFGIEKARLQIENVPFDAEAELDFLSHRF